MEAIRKRYNDLPIKMKLVSVILIGLFLLSCACITGIQVANYSNQKILFKTLASSLSYSAKELRDSFKGIETISYQAVTDMAVQEQLSMLHEDADNTVIRANAFRQLNTSLLNYYYSQERMIHFISLESDAIHISTNTVLENKLPNDYLEDMNEAALKADGRVVWIYHTDLKDSLSAVRCVKRITPFWRDNLGIVIINVRLSELIEASTQFSDQFGEGHYILLDGSNVLYASSNLSSNMKEQAVQMQENSYKIMKANGHRYFAVAGTVPEYGWQYVNLVLYDDTYSAIQNSMYLYILTLLIGVGVTVTLCHRLVNRLTVHITSLLEKMHIFSQNNDKVPITTYDYHERKDELGVLHQQFDQMAEKIISLIQTDYINQILVKDAQLKALEAQIDPHFLYNVLQHISWSAKVSGNKKIMDMVDMLGKMLRTTLSRGDETFTIGKEADFVNSYLTIQKYRFEEQLVFSIAIPSEIESVYIPKLTLQPLVENAIRYAMDESDEVCAIEVIGEKKEDEIVISVKNSGSEFEEDLLAKLEEKQVIPNGFGIGLLNISKRLQLFHKHGCYLKLFNEDEMAVAEVHIALCETGGKYPNYAKNDDCG